MKNIHLFATATAIFCLHATLSSIPAFSQSGSRNPAPQPNSSFQQNFQTAPQPAPRPAARASSAAPTFQPLNVAHGFNHVDHRRWDSLLRKYVDRNGNVDYPRWQVDQRDRSELRNYLRHLGSVDTSISATRQSQMAFWINAYNALTIEGILQLFPTTSIKNHAPDANGFNIWDDFKLPVDGREYSLNAMEHEILRKMGDPRIHFAIVCASRGCPQLAQRAYLPQSLDRQLTESTRAFFRSPEKFRVDLQRQRFELSPIIKWFGDDFGRDDAERLRFLAQFMPSEQAARLATNGYATVGYLDYDWSLNLAAATSQTPVTTFQPAGSQQGRPMCQGRGGVVDAREFRSNTN